jgi:hypothetical protein
MDGKGIIIYSGRDNLVSGSRNDARLLARPPDSASVLALHCTNGVCLPSAMISACFDAITQELSFASTSGQVAAACL